MSLMVIRNWPFRFVRISARSWKSWGCEVVVVAGDLPVWRVEEEERVGAVVSGDQVAEVFALDLDIYQALPGAF